ncbi:hypothetical protein [Ulvibacter antarcticus]|uniref:Lipoprotein n=1 Tax=Ulvibacter antarcticus TaxID=442714 RepID=A0A3L9YYR3_9FLAO|nr:hypothetical protein [Ulvibacter antarcticus]RMA65796.1 hypothetical protein BXY75_0209 [Ulvibacter antarcticus]
MKILKVTLVATFAMFALGSCTQDSEIMNTTAAADLSFKGSTPAYCDDNYTLNFVDGPHYRSKVVCTWDSGYDGGAPPEVIVHEIEWQANDDVIYPKTVELVQGDLGVIVEFTSAELEGKVEGRWRVRVQGGGGNPDCEWSDWVDHWYVGLQQTTEINL